MKKPNIPQDWAGVLGAFVPRGAREEAELAAIRRLMDREGDGLLWRENGFAHFTASAIIVNPARDKTLMAYHRIYRSWAWTGGHADGETFPEALARREAAEETGIAGLRRIGDGPLSVEVLPVWAHERHGRAVGSHLHLNVSFVFLADEGAPLRSAPDENSAVGWLPAARLHEYVTEPDMLPVYRRLLDRANDCEILP